MVGSVIAPDAEERLEDLEQEFAFMYMGSEVPEVTLERMGRDVLALESEAEVMEYLGFSAVLGTLDEGTCGLGRISLASGAYPQAEDEIAVVRSFLTRMGYGAELGQTIQVEVYSPGSETVTKEYRLCGILEPYGGGWNTKTYPLVSAVITPEAAEQYPWEPSYNGFLDYAGSVSESPYIYGLNESG